MIQETSNWSIKRILVPLDASMHSQAALKAGIKLAASFKAQLIALFVEDIHLLQLSELSFAREICSFSPTCRLLNRSELVYKQQTSGNQFSAWLKDMM